MTTRDNRRKHERTEINITTRVTYKNGATSEVNDTLAKTKDLSQGGALLNFSDPVPIETLEELEFQIPDLPGRIRTQADIKWLSEDGNQLQAGVQFTSLSSSEQEAIDTFLNRNQSEGFYLKASPVRFQEFKMHLSDAFNLSKSKQESLEGVPPEKLYDSARGLGIQAHELAEFIAEHLAVDYAPALDPDDVDLRDLTETFCSQNHLVPMVNDQRDPIFVLSNPYRHVCHSVFKRHYGKKDIQFLITEPQNIENLFLDEEETASDQEEETSSEGLFVMQSEANFDIQEEKLETETTDDEYGNIENQKKKSQSNNIIRTVNKLLISAVKEGVSDIHIEPRDKNLLVRYRVDGVLQNRWEFSKKLAKVIITRIKIMADMDIAERRKPQDGGFRMMYQNRRVDVRVSVIPVSKGEKAVLRVLDKESAPMNLKGLGFKEKSLNLLKDSLNSTKGILYFTGPTGSGKTTTMYTCLKMLSSPEVNIQTVEDPIEYDISGLNQMEVHRKAGLDFAGALRGILRQDPDILMIGEIRDSETLDIAAKAAMSGHLVLTTLHTNDAASTVDRLIDLGLDPFYVANTTRIIVAQRLMRRLCSNCKTPVDDVEMIIDQYPILEQFDANLYETTGCKNCDHTGYRGQMGVMECLPATDAFREAVRKERGTDFLRSLMKDEMNLHTLRENAFEQVAKGNTSLDEALRVSMI